MNDLQVTGVEAVSAAAIGVLLSSVVPVFDEDADYCCDTCDAADGNTDDSTGAEPRLLGTCE